MTTTRQNGRIEIGASDLLDLLSGAIIATGKDSSLPTLTVAHPTITWRGGIMPMRYTD